MDIAIKFLTRRRATLNRPSASHQNCHFYIPSNTQAFLCRGSDKYSPRKHVQEVQEWVPAKSRRLCPAHGNDYSRGTNCQAALPSVYQGGHEDLQLQKGICCKPQKQVSPNLYALSPSPCVLTCNLERGKKEETPAVCSGVS